MGETPKPPVHPVRFGGGRVMDEWLYNPDASRVRGDAKTYGPSLILRDGIAMVAGDSGTGKSTWLLSMLHWWNRMEPFFDDDACAFLGEAPPFWYFAFEDGNNMRNAYDGFKSLYTESLEPKRPELLYRQIEGGIYDCHTERSQVLFTPPVGALDLTDLENVEAFCDAAFDAVERVGRWESGPAVVVIDNLSLCIGDADESEGKTARKVVRGLERIRDSLEADLVILVHHTVLGTDKPHGSRFLFAHMDSVAILSGKGETLTATNAKMKGAPSGARRKYQRIVRRTNGAGPSFVDFGDITTATAKPAQPQPTADNAAPLEAPPSAPAHPAMHLRGLPLELWQRLALGGGASIGAEAAKATAMELPAFAGLEPRRRSSRFSQVLGALLKAGLYDEKTGRITNV